MPLTEVVKETLASESEDDSVSGESCFMEVMSRHGKCRTTTLLQTAFQKDG
jgi:hypothetical protein